MAVSLVVGENLFKSPAQTLVNTVNTVGVMGKGLAKKFADRFPDMLADYEIRCAEGAENRLTLGRPYLFRRPETPWILNFPTKDHWRSSSRLAPILEGLAYLRERLSEWEIESLAVPPLGCGHGGLEWRAVGQLYVNVLDSFQIPVTLFAPFEVPWIRGSTEPLRLFPDLGGSEVPPPRSLVPTMWIEFCAALAGFQESTRIGRAQFVRVSQEATREGLETGMILDESHRDGVVGLQGVMEKLLNNGLLDASQQGRQITYGAGPAARALIEFHRDGQLPMGDILAQVLSTA